jgi:hypothetical protein
MMLPTGVSYAMYGVWRQNEMATPLWLDGTNANCACPAGFVSKAVSPLVGLALPPHSIKRFTGSSEQATHPARLTQSRVPLRIRFPVE